MYLGDTTNYSDLNDSTADFYGFTTISDKGGNWYQMKTLNRDVCISGPKNLSDNYKVYQNVGGHTYKISFEFSSTVKGSKDGAPIDYIRVGVGLYGKTSDGNPVWNIVADSTLTKGDANGTIKSYSNIVSLDTNIVGFGVYIQLEADNGTFSGTLKIRNVKVVRMTDASLIVNGAIQAHHIQSGSITADKIQSGTITADKILGNKLSGTTIEGGTIKSTSGNIGGFEIGTYNLVGNNVGMSAASGNGYAFWAGINGASNSSSAPFKVGHEGKLYATNAEITGTIKGATNINIGSDITQNGVTYTAFKVERDGNLKIGGASAHVHGDGLRKGVAEITSLGTIYSCHKSDPNTYTQIQEGHIEICNGGYDSDHGNFLDRKIVMQNGEFYISSYSDEAQTTRKKEIAIFGNIIYSNMYDHIDIQEKLNVQNHVVIYTNAQAFRGVDTNGTEVALAHVGSDNVIRLGYGSWKGDSDACYTAGTELTGGAKINIKSKDLIYLTCNSSKQIVWKNDSTDSYVFRPNDQNADIMLGTKSYSWNICYAKSGVNTTSDRTMKENIQYLNYNHINEKTIRNNNITTKDCLDFITNDYLLATYNYISDKDKSTRLSAIAQDVISNDDGSDNIIGQLIVTAQESAEENAILCMNQTQLLNVAIGAIQSLNDKVKSLESELNVVRGE